MKMMTLAAPLALLLASTAFAQTSDAPSSDPPDGSGEMMYGTEWPEAVGSTFMTRDGDKTTMRSKEEIAASWTALTQADRDAVIADCKAFTEEAGGDKGDGSAPAGADATGAPAELAARAGISGADMALVCETVSTL